MRGAPPADCYHTYITRRRRPPSCGFRFAALSHLDPVQRRGVVARALARALFGNASKVLRDPLARMGPGGIGMGKIRGPHVVVFAKELPRHRPNRIVLEGSKKLAPDVFARLHL